MDMNKDPMKLPGANANEISFSKPIHGNPDFTLNASLYQFDRDHSNLRSFRERLRGGSLKLRHIFPSNTSLVWEGGYEGVWRHNHSIGSDASLRFF
jgi:hypothetical protein